MTLQSLYIGRNAIQGMTNLSTLFVSTNGNERRNSFRKFNN